MNILKSKKNILVLASLISMTALYPIAANAFGIPKIKIPSPRDIINSAGDAAKSVTGSVADTAANSAGWANGVAADAAAKAQGFANAAESIAMGYANSAVLTTYSGYATTAGYANLAAADAAAKALKYASYIDRLTKTSIPFAPGEFDNLSKNIQQPWSRLIIETRQMAGVGQGAVLSTSRMLLRQPGINIMSELAQQCAGNVIATSDTIRTIAPQVIAMGNLQPEQVNALTRILRTLLQRGSFDQQLAADMKAVGTAVGYFQKNFPANFSISVTGSAGSDNMGGSIAVGYAMDTFPTDGKYRSALTISGGPSVSVKANPQSVNMNFVMGLSQGSSVDVEGASYGVGATVGIYNGGLSWDLPPLFEETVVKTSMKLVQNITEPTKVRDVLLSTFKQQIETICAQPSVSGAVSLPYEKPVELTIAFSAGYTRVLQKYAF